MQKYVVGGAVRDRVLGLEPNDFDYVVIGATPEDMLQAGYKRVGKDFPVFLDQHGFEHALARKELKIGPKHTDFIFDFGPHVTLSEDIQRRDFTCNALVYDETKDEIIDLVGGLQDINDKIIRHVNSEHFGEDPLRVLRMCRFAAQLDFLIAPETMLLAQNMVAHGMLAHLTKERIWKEFAKALSTPHFDIFINTMQQCGALQDILPDIDVKDLYFSFPQSNLSAQIKFALWTYNQTNENIKYICKCLKSPTEYGKFALLLKEYGTAIRDYLHFTPEQKISFLAGISQFKYPKILADFLTAANAIAPLQNIVTQCLADYALVAPIKAHNLPNFDNLSPGPQMAEALLTYQATVLKTEMTNHK